MLFSLYVTIIYITCNWSTSFNMMTWFNFKKRMYVCTMCRLKCKEGGTKMMHVRTTLFLRALDVPFDRRWRTMTVLSPTTEAILVRVVYRRFTLRLVNIRKCKNKIMDDDSYIDDNYHSVLSPPMRSQRIVFVSIYCYANIIICSILGAQYFFIFLIYRDTLFLSPPNIYTEIYVTVPMCRTKV